VDGNSQLTNTSLSRCEYLALVTAVVAHMRNAKNVYSGLQNFNSMFFFVKSFGGLFDSQLIY